MFEGEQRRQAILVAISVILLLFCGAFILAGQAVSAQTAPPVPVLVSPQGAVFTTTVAVNYDGVPPPAPVPLSPSGVTSNTTPTYSWQEAATAADYQIYLTDADGQFVYSKGVSAAAVCTAGTCSHTPTPVLDEADYNWHVRASNSDGTGPWSPALAFTVFTGSAAPGPATLLAPNSTIADTTPTYSWQAVTDAIRYRVYLLDGDRLFAHGTTVQARNACSAGTCSYNMPSPLPDGDYRYFIRAENPLGGTWSAPMLFTLFTGSAAPGPATLVAPNGTTGDATPTYQWNEVPQAIKYKVYLIDDDRLFAYGTIVQAQNACIAGTCSHTAPFPLPDGDYRFFIQAINPLGATWSAPMLFTLFTGSAAPGQATPVAPNGAISDSTPTYEWLAASDAIRYQVYLLDGSSQFVYGVFVQARNACSGANCSLTPAIVLPNDDYTWYVQALNPLGAVWSPKQNFSYEQPRPDLELVKHSQVSAAFPGDTIIYTLTYSNTGGALAAGVVLSDTVPENSSFYPAGSRPGWTQVGATNHYTYSLDSLAIDAQGVVTFTVTVDDPLPPGTEYITNTASISDDDSQGPDPTPGNNEAVETTPLATGPTYFCETINENTTWTLSESPYVLTCALTVSAGVTLTLEAGTIIKFQGNHGILVNGTIATKGTAFDLIHITSIKDDSVGGDTNNDDDDTSPAPGNWRAINFEGNAKGSFSHTHISYGGYEGIYHDDGQIEIYGDADVSFDNSSINQSASRGIKADASSPNNIAITLTNSTIASSGREGIFLSNSSNYDLTIDGSSFLDNGGDGIDANQLRTASISNSDFSRNGGYAGILRFNADGVLATTVNLTGSDNGKNVLGLEGTLNGETVLAGNQLPFGIYGIMTIPTGSSLIIEAGAIFKQQNPTQTRLHINGTLDVQGTEAQPVHFTSLKDASVGGDSNSNDPNDPAPGNWGEIRFEGNAKGSFSHTHISYGGYEGIYHDDGQIEIYGDADVSFDNSSINQSASRGIKADASSPNNIAITLTNSTIASSGREGIFLSNSSNYDLTIDGSSFLDNGGDGIDANQLRTASISNSDFSRNGGYAGILRFNADGVLATTVNLTGSDNGKNVLGLEGTLNGETVLAGNQLPFGIYGIMTIPTGSSLIIEAGAIFKQQNPTQTRLHINGTLDVQGTEAQPVHFTSLKDASVGGDSNSNDPNDPAPGNWGEIRFEGNAKGSFSHTHISYGGYEGIYHDDGQIEIYGDADVSFDNSSINQSASRGIKADASSPNNIAITLTNSTIASSGQEGIRVHGSGSHDLLLDGCFILGNGGDGIELHSIRNVNIHYCHIYGNGGHGVFNELPPTTVDARYNYWGSDDGPAPFGTGDSINTYSEYDPGCDCNVIRPAVIFAPWLDAAGNVMGIPIGQSGGSGGLPSDPISRWVAEPVNAVFGNYVYQYVDLAFPTLDMDFGFQRTYNSVASDNGPLGPGWSHSYYITATQTSTNTVVVMHGDGRKDLYTGDTAGNYLPPPGIHDRLTWNTDHFVLIRKDQVVYTFNPDGTLSTIADPNGNQTSLAYAGGNLTTVIEPSGRAVTFSYTGNLLSQIGDPAGRSVSFGYTGGLLTSVTDVNSQTTAYAYDANGLLESITDANGHTFVHNIYDAKGRVIEQLDALGNLTTLNYDTAARQTTVTDPRGYTTVYAYDSAFRVIAETDPLGYAVNHTFDVNNNRTCTTDKRGNTTSYTYDGRGNLLTSTDSLGNTTIYTYDVYNNLLSETNPRGYSTTYSYDTNHNLTSRTDALGHVTTWSYDTNGLVQSATDPLGNSTTYTYDAYGHQDSVTDALGHVTSYTYDIAGRLLSETNAEGYTTAYTHDLANRLLTVTDPLGNVESYTYDLVGNRVSSTNPRGAVTTFVYDAKDRLASTTDPLGNTTTYAYDSVNNQVAVTDPLNHSTSYGYDTLNRRISVSDALGNSTGYSYDPNGNRTAISDANGNTTSYTYDARNLLSSVTDAEGGIVTYAYDANGNRTSMTDANGHITTYTYDELDRLSTITDPLGHVVGYTYDAAGNRISQTKADGVVLNYTYDALYRLISTTTPSYTISYSYDSLGNRTTMTDTVGTTHYNYDPLNRLIDVESPILQHPLGDINGDCDVNLLDYNLLYAAYGTSEGDTNYDPAADLNSDGTIDIFDYNILIGNYGLTCSATTLAYDYDANGNRTHLTYPDGRVVTTTYDLADRLSTVTDWDGRITSYSYDAANRQTGINYPNGVTAAYDYDPADRLLSILHTSPVSGTIAAFTYTLDAVGNRLTMDDLQGTTSYIYDKLYRLRQVTYPDGDVVEYIYDSMGNRLIMNSSGSLTTYAYDDDDRLLAIYEPGITTNLDWDENGNMIGKGSAIYTFDPLDRLTEVISGTLSVQFSYDGDGVRLGKVVSGTATSYVQDIAAPLPVVLAESTAGQTQHYLYGNDLLALEEPSGTDAFYHQDGLGSIRALSDISGRSSDMYTFYAFGDIRSQSGSSTQPFMFASEPMDIQLGLIYLRSRYYDPETGRFLTRDTVNGSVLHPKTWNYYVYVFNNPVLLIDPMGFWGVSRRVNIGAAGGFLGGVSAKGGIGPELEFPSWNPLDWEVGYGYGETISVKYGPYGEATPTFGGSVYLWDRVNLIPTVSDQEYVTVCGGGGGGALANANIAVCTGKDKTGVKVAADLGASAGGYGFVSVGVGESHTKSLRELWNDSLNLYNSWFGGGNYGAGPPNTPNEYYYVGGGSGGGGGGSWGGPPSSSK